MVKTVKSVYLDVTGKKKPPKGPVVTEGEEGSVTPTERVSKKVDAKSDQPLATY
jgi:hypothetical protein